MNKHEYDERLASANAGHMALAIIEQHGLDMGAVVLRGMMCAFVKANAAVVGWESTRQIINDLARPVAQSKPHLTIVK